MTDPEQVTLIRTQSLQQIADLRANPKPSYELDGQRISWDSYLAALERTVDWCDRKLNDWAPFEVRSEGLT